MENSIFKNLASDLHEKRAIVGAELPVELPGGQSVLGNQGVETKKNGLTIIPVPVFTLKTRLCSSLLKVFINVCSHEHISTPAVVKKLNDIGKEVEGMNIPMSIGPCKPSSDKSGKECHVYDVIMNPKVAIDIQEDNTGSYRDFVCQLAMQSLEQKYAIQLEKKYKLPKLTYMGEISSQYVQDRRNAPVIQEVESSSKGEAMARMALEKARQLEAARKQAEAVAEIDLPFSFSWVIQADGSTADVPVHPLAVPNTYVEPMTTPPMGAIGVALTTTLPFAPDASKLDVKVSAFKIQIKIIGFHRLLLHMPCCIRPGTATCILTRPPGLLRTVGFRLTISLDPRPWDAAPDPGSKPWQVATALRGDNPYADDTYTEEHAGSMVGDDVGGTRMRSTGEDEYVEEDQFHKRGGGTDADDTATAELPEDRFHKKDAASSFIISQREKEISDKREKHAREKEERKNDPNVEYVDSEDYKPGGKLGPKLADADRLVTAAKDGSSDVFRSAAAVVRNTAQQLVVEKVALSSTLWSELLE